MGPTMVLCPYCGSLSAHLKQCTQCSGYFDLLSRQRSQNAMGPWFIRDVSRAFQPGCSLGTLVRMTQRGKIKPETVIRGPSTRQFWTFARNTPGISHLLGECHSCHTPVMPIAKLCSSCNASFVADDDRQNMGLSPVHLLPGDADTATIAASLGSKAPPPTIPTQPPPQMPVAPLPEVPQQPVEPPAPPFPIPEVRVISADERTGPPVALMLGIAVAAIMVAGVGIWAWMYLSGLTAPSQDTTTIVSTEHDVVPVDSNPIAEHALADEHAAPEPTVPQPQDEAPVADEGIEAESDPEPVRPDPIDTARLAYDRIVVGIASSSLGDEEFESLLAQVSENQRPALRKARKRRAEQIRLGRAGD